MSSARTAPFDATARSYDESFTQTPLARALRRIVWERLDSAFPPSSRVLELACGTGEDAHHLASRDVHVTATDHSEAMLAVAREKCSGLPVDYAPLDLRNLDIGNWELGIGNFDGVFSNFGGLNVLSDYRPLASFLAPLVRPGGKLIFVVMGRWCAWEVLWHLAQLDARMAFRRLNPKGATASIGDSTIPVYYPTTADLHRDLDASGFRLIRARPLGLLLPPSYLEPLTRSWLFPFRLFEALDRILPWPLWGDHTVHEFVRNPG